MTFDSPLLLFLAPLVGACRRLRRLARPAAADPARAAVVTFAGDAGASPGGWAPLVLALGGLLAAVGLAGPRGGRTRGHDRDPGPEPRLRGGHQPLDAGRGRGAEPAAARVREARRLVQDLEGDRLGLIAFAGQSYILAPLTVDGGAIRMYLDALDPDLASEGGTNLARCWRRAAELLGAATDAADRVLVCLHRRRSPRHAAGERGRGRGAQGRRASG